jgi:hypothetical protein
MELIRLWGLRGDVINVFGVTESGELAVRFCFFGSALSSVVAAVRFRRVDVTGAGEMVGCVDSKYTDGESSDCYLIIRNI